MTNWKTIPINECAEPLVPLGPFSQYPHLGGSAIYAGERVDSPYYPRGLEGSLTTHFARKGAADRLDRFARSLPVGIIAWIEDIFRKLETQTALYDWHFNELRSEHLGWDNGRLIEEAQHIVSLPSSDPSRPSPHNTGGSVDISLARLPLARWIEWRGLILLIERIKKHDPEEQYSWKKLYLLHMRVMDICRRFSNLLPMGTLFDEVRPQTAADYYVEFPPATPEQRICLRYRKLLRKSMERVGFTQYKWEWWHFNSGNQMWAEESGSGCATYGAAVFSDENRWWENMRRAHYRRQLTWLNGGDVLLGNGGKLGVNPFATEALAFAKRWAPRFSNPAFTLHPKASTL